MRAPPPSPGTAGADERPFTMIVDLQRNFHSRPTCGYRSKMELLDTLKIAVIDRAIEKHNRLRGHKAKAGIFMLTMDDLLRSSRKREAGRPRKKKR